MTESGQPTQIRTDEFLAVAAPWLADFGSWIFGALIALNLVILGAALTIGPVDVAVKVATAGTAISLAPGAVGLLLLRVLTDVRSIRRSRTADSASHEPGPPRLNMVALRYTVSLLLITFLLSLVGLTAAVWHIAWWIAAAFLVALGGSLVMFVLAASRLGAFGSRGPQ